ncbi:hypothetical protein, partial [Amycolatopsis sp. NPDC003676]
MSTPGGSDGQSLSVVPEEVSDVGRYVYGLAETLRAALDSASGDVEALLSGGWLGDLADEFGTGWTETSSRGAVLRETPGRYEVVEQEVEDPRQGELRVQM